MMPKYTAGWILPVVLNVDDSSLKACDQPNLTPWAGWGENKNKDQVISADLRRLSLTQVYKMTAFLFEFINST